tara:strand:- start:531 stop:863 length:333 start_codon:yes stop_codon:yes gene_type:complete
MNHVLSSFAAEPCDNINDILPLTEMNPEVAASVWKSIKSINELILIDEEEDYVQFIEGGYTFQVLSSALKSIEELTKSKPKYVVEVIKTFRLDEYLVIPDRLYELASETP